MMLVVRRVLAVVLVVSVALMAAAAVSAVAAEPWWHLSVGARPSFLKPVAGTGEQEIDAVEDKLLGVVPIFVGSVEVGGESVGCLSGGGDGGLVCSVGDPGAPVLETSEQLEAALEGVYGPHSVKVSGAGLFGSEPWSVVTPGRTVAPVNVRRVGFFGALLGGAETKILSEGGNGRLVLAAYNLGDAATSGPVTLSDRLPAGLTATRITGLASPTGGLPENTEGLLQCTLDSVSCTFTGTLEPYERMEVVVWVAHAGTAVSGERNEVLVSGGGAREVSRSEAVSFGEGQVPFGVESYEQEPEEEGGLPDTRAGSHPYQLTTILRMNETAAPPFQPAQPRNLKFYLPAGLVGDAQATPQCSYADFITRVQGRALYQDTCPADTAVGVSLQGIGFGEGSEAGYGNLTVPVFNLVPARGEPARFGFDIDGVPVVLNTSVRTGGDYGVTVSVNDLTQSVATVIPSVVSIWGDPAAHAHDISRGWACLIPGEADSPPGCESSLGTSLPLLTLPSACESFQAPMQAQSWVPGAELLPKFESEWEAPLDSCNKLPFGAGIEVAPDIQSASTPTGLKVDVHVPQEAALNPEGLVDADVRTMTVALPAGMTLDPSGANGLEACSESQIGFEGPEAGEPARELFSAVLGNPFCPDGSKIGTAKITTPLLPNPLEGAVYLADPAPGGEAGQNPFASLVALYIVAQDPVSGTLVKVPGKVVPCESAGQVVAGVSCGAAGQLITTFEDSPQLPFEDAELHFFGGENAPLATPALCGSYTTHAVFAPWSGGASVPSSSTFDITSGPHGTPCADPRPFEPEFEAGMTNIQAGGFSELQTTMGHPDADQTLGGLQIKLPPGLSGLLSSVKLCGEPQAAEGTCGPESLIGHTIVTAGFGSSPAVIKRPGNVYITGPYEGAPFGLSIANPAEAGPFDLERGTPCDCVVVRAKIEVDPHTAALTVTSDPLPTMIKGIPLDLQHVQVAIAREVNGGKGFAFNPTSCEPLSITGTMSSSEGASSAISTPFHVTNCAALKFDPKFSVSTSGRTSRVDGASLSVKLSEPANSLGSQANVRQVKVELPVQLPSRLKTLQKACTAAQFKANPADCPAASIVGHAIVHTPLLPVPLEGPAYFVSNGGEAFPNLVMVLQGDNVKVELVGDTFISSAGVTSSTFKTVPDVPFSTFELNLPEQPNSALAANINLCASTRTVTVKERVTVKTGHGGHRTVTKRVKQTAPASLTMPTEFVAQNGAELHVRTPVSVTGCAVKKAKPTARHAKQHHRHVQRRKK